MRKLGHCAFSCDLVPCSGGFPEWHIQGDVLPLLNGNCSFTTMDGKAHKICGKWDMIIDFPPCTYLTKAGVRHFSPKCNLPEKIAERERLRENAVAFFLKFANADCEKIAIENPVGYMSTHYKNAINMELTDDEKDILDLVITRFLVALSPQHEYTETEYIFDIAGETFKCKTKISDKLGWRRFVKPDDKDKNYPLSYSEGDIIDVGSIAIIEGETAPPKRYTESTLLKAMENIDRRIDDKELSEYVSERGLGTPATRAAIIDKILNDNYAERKGKQLIPTEMGKKMIDFAPDEVKSIEMTATMELQLSAVENGTVNADEVVSNIIGKIKSIIETEKKKPHTPVVKPKFEPKVPLGKCPKCGGNVFKFVRDNTAIFYCENSPKTCFFRIYEDDYFFSTKGKRITEDMMRTMLTRGEVKVCGLKSDKKATTYDAFIFVSDKVRTDPKGNTKVCFDMRFENKQKKGGK